jgi:hypothetical protein
MSVFSPNEAKKTLLSVNSPIHSGDQLWFGGAQNSTTQFDGFTLLTYSNAITGTIRVYGLRNS